MLQAITQLVYFYEHKMTAPNINITLDLNPVILFSKVHNQDIRRNTLREWWAMDLRRVWVAWREVGDFSYVTVHI